MKIHPHLPIYPGACTLGESRATKLEDNKQEVCVVHDANCVCGGVLISVVVCIFYQLSEGPTHSDMQTDHVTG